jgi:hypothetical protein
MNRRDLLSSFCVGAGMCTIQRDLHRTVRAELRIRLLTEVVTRRNAPLWMWTSNLT